MIQIFAGSLRQRTRITMITLCPFGRYCRPVCCTFSPIQYNRNVATKTLYVCSNCGHAEPKWLGRCPDCGEWSTFVEEVRESKKVVGFAERAMRQKGGVAGRTLSLSEVPVVEDGGRMDAGVGELNRVLGGGIVPGSMVLVGGEPGVGKSTLLLQVMGHLGEGCMMVSGEESTRQGALRDGCGRDRGDDPARAAGGGGGGLDPDALLAGAYGGTGGRGAGAGDGRPAHAARQGRRHRRYACRARDEGGLYRRAAGAGAHGGYGPAVRGGPLSVLPRTARSKEPFRLHE